MTADQEYDAGVHDARLTLRAWLGGNPRMLFGDDEDVMWSWCLARNIRDAAIGCASYALGANPPDLGPGERFEMPGCLVWIPDGVWMPGCGEKVPKEWECPE